MVDGQSSIQYIDYAKSYKVQQNLVECVWQQARVCHQSQGKMAHVLDYIVVKCTTTERKTGIMTFLTWQQREHHHAWYCRHLSHEAPDQALQQALKKDCFNNVITSKHSSNILSRYF